MITDTQQLRDCLARLNALQQAVDDAKVKAFTPLYEDGGITYYDREDWYVATQFLQEGAPDAITLANKLHAETELLKALLVECESAFVVAQMDIAACGILRGRKSIHEDADAIDEILHYANQIEASQIPGRARIDAILTKLHAAGIGGE